MFLAEIDHGEAGSEFADEPHDSLLAVVASAVWKSSVAAASGLVLTCGLALVLWAVTPSSGSSPLSLVRAGVAAFSSANGMTVTIGRAALTIPPLMLTAVAVAVLTSVIGRGRVIARGRTQEFAAGVAAVLVYAIVITGVAVVAGPTGDVPVTQWWRPGLLALLVVGCTTLIRGDGWRPFLLSRLPHWLPVSIRLGGAGAALLVGGGAVTLLIGLVRSFSDGTTVQTLAAPGAAGGFGMALLGIAYLPNAVLAAVGYSTGVGFTIGSGTYSPFGSSPTELPAVSLLTAAPDGSAFARPTLLLLLFPVLAAVLIGRGAVRRLDRRADRLFAAGAAAVLAAVVLAVLAEAASGGVSGGEWSSSGVPPQLLALVVAVGVGAVAAAVAGTARVTAAQVGRTGQVGEVAEAEPAGNVDDRSGAAAAAGDDVAGDDAAETAAREHGTLEHGTFEGGTRDDDAAGDRDPHAASEDAGDVANTDDSYGAVDDGTADSEAAVNDNTPDAAATADGDVGDVGFDADDDADDDDPADANDPADADHAAIDHAAIDHAAIDHAAMADDQQAAAKAALDLPEADLLTRAALETDDDPAADLTPRSARRQVS